MDRIVLTKFHGPEVPGNYAVSAQVGGMFGLFTLLISQAWNPMVYRRFAEGDATGIHRLLRVGLSIAMILPVVGILFAYISPLIFKYILARDYSVDKSIVLATCLKGAFDGWYYLVSAPLFFYEKNKQLTAVTMGVGLVTGLFLWVFGAALDGLDIAATLAVSTLVQTIIISVLSRRYWKAAGSRK
jgi:O-antigen/teichoic acid export membrane protein